MSWKCGWLVYRFRISFIIFKVNHNLSLFSCQKYGRSISETLLYSNIRTLLLQTIFSDKGLYSLMVTCSKKPPYPTTQKREQNFIWNERHHNSTLQIRLSLSQKANRSQYLLIKKRVGSSSDFVCSEISEGQITWKKD